MSILRNVNDDRHEITNSCMHTHHKLSDKKKYHDKEYTCIDDKIIELDMEYSHFQMPSCQQSVGIPILPQRNNALRTAAKLKKELSKPKEVILKTHKEFYNAPMLRSSDLHDVYLSSEEDISIKDSNEDFLFDSDDSESDFQFEAYDRESQGIIARAVSFRAAGKPQIIEINCQSSSNSPRTSISSSDRSSQRPLLPRLPALSIALGEFHLDAHELFPPSPSSPSSQSTQKQADSLQSNALVNASAYRSYADTTPQKQILEPNTSLSIFRRGSLLSRRSQITQSIIQMSTHATKNSPTTASKISCRINALKHVTRNIKNTGISKISLAYTPGVVPRRT